MSAAQNAPVQPPVPLRLLTRGSPLALAQARESEALLRAALPARPVELRIVRTTGDRQLAWVLEKQGGTGLFTAELENALLAGAGDLAVHSAKDLPSAIPAGLALAGFLPRANAADVLVRRAAAPRPARIATGSPRRRAQARATFPDAEFCELRGNVATRLAKIAAGDADATFLAAAGLARLGIRDWDGLVFEEWGLKRMVPAAGQAAIAWQTRTADAPALAPLCDPRTTAAVTVERLVLAALGGGCHASAGVHWRDGALHLFTEAAGRLEIPFPLDDAETAAIAVAGTGGALAMRVRAALKAAGIALPAAR